MNSRTSVSKVIGLATLACAVTAWLAVAPGAQALQRAAAAGSALYTHLHVRFIATLPNANTLISISATSKADAWAVGSDFADPNAGAYAVHWNGHTWRQLRFPDPSFAPRSVRASSARDAWFVGYEQRPNLQPEALRWDGSAWHVLALPADPRLVPVIFGPADAWFQGGSSWSRAHGWRTELAHWNGHTWTSYRLPMWASDNAIAGSSPRNLLAVGLSTSTRPGTRPPSGWLVGYHWTGTQWRRAALPRVSMQGPVLLAASPSGEAWINGTGSARERYQPFVFYRPDGTWRRLPNRKLGVTSALQLGSPLMPDGLNGVWFGGQRYWSGGSVGDGFGKAPTSCGSLNLIDGTAFMAAVPRTHSMLMAVACQRTARATVEGAVLITEPR
jgi:hypothetical protein